MSQARRKRTRENELECEQKEINPRLRTKVTRHTRSNRDSGTVCGVRSCPEPGCHQGRRQIRAEQVAEVRHKRTTCIFVSGSWRCPLCGGCPSAWVSSLMPQAWPCTYTDREPTVRLRLPGNQWNCRCWSRFSPHTLKVSEHKQSSGHQSQDRLLLGQLHPS